LNYVRTSTFYVQGLNCAQSSIMYKERDTRLIINLLLIENVFFVNC